MRNSSIIFEVGTHFFQKVILPGYSFRFAFIKLSNADADAVLNDPNYINFNGHDLQIKSRNSNKSVSNTTQSSRAMSEGNRSKMKYFYKHI